MALIPGLQLPYGIQPVNALPVDSLSGPYEGANAAAAIAAANAAIDVALRFKSLEVRLVYGGTSYKYWYRAGTADGDLELFSSALTTVSGLDTHVQFNDGGASFGGDAGLTYNKTTDTLTIAGDLVVNGGDLTTTAATFNLLNDTATTVNLAGGASTALNLGNTSATNTVLGKTKFSQGLSGSLTKLTDGSSYIIGGGNVSISSASNGAITLATINSGTIHGVTAGTGLTGGGASGAVTLNINDSVVATVSGSTFTGVTKHSAGLSGSLTNLIDGSSYIIGGGNVSVSSASNGAITIASTAAGSDTHIQFNDGGTSFGGDAGLTYNKTTDTLTIAGDLVVNGGDITTTAATFNLLNDTATTVNLAGGASTALNLGNASATNTILGKTKFSQGLSGSLTQLTDGTSFLIAGSGISILSASNGTITISNDGTVGDITAITAGTGLTGGGTSGSITLNINDSIVATISGSTFTGVTKHNAGLSGSLTNLVDGSSYIIGGGNVSISSASNGAITLATINSGTIHGVTAGTGLTGGGASGAVTLNINDSVVATVSGSTFTGAVKFNQGLSGSLTKLTNGDSYLVGATTSTMNQTGSILISSASNGQVTISSYVFPNDLSVSLTNNRTFGRYASGATIPATGKTPAEVILLAIAEPIDPTVSIAGTNPITSTFGISGSINSSITGSYTINTLGGSVSAARLQFRSGSSGDYTILSTSTTSPLNFDHTFTVGAFFTTALNYEYIITDSGGAFATGSLTLTPQAYSAPSISLTVTTTTPGSVTGETNSKREKGNVGSTITGTITRNRANAPLSSYSVQYQVNGAGAWVDVPGLSSVSASGSSVSIPSTSHDDATLKTSTSLVYRVQVVDSYQTTTSSSTTISFLNVIFHAAVANAPTTSANVRAIANKVFTDSANPFNLITGTVENDFAVALPTTSAPNDTISNVVDLDALSADITANYVLSTFNVDDAGGTAVSYNVYTLSNATPYTTSHRHQITRA